MPAIFLYRLPWYVIMGLRCRFFAWQRRDSWGSEALLSPCWRNWREGLNVNLPRQGYGPSDPYSPASVHPALGAGDLGTAGARALRSHVHWLLGYIMRRQWTRFLPGVAPAILVHRLPGYLSWGSDARIPLGGDDKSGVAGLIGGGRDR